MRTVARAWSAVGVVVVAIVAVAACIQPYTPPDYTDEDAGTGYHLDLGPEDLGLGPPLPGHYHPQGYSFPAAHGRELKLQAQDCRTCHGQNLEGGPAISGYTTAPPSCNDCHRAGWRTDCTFCHGTPGGSAAPPRDLDGQFDPKKISFPGHVAHVSGRIAQAYDCIQCHRKPTDVLTPYHVFDASPRRGENNLSGGLSPAGIYDPVQRGCRNTYCHGNGIENGVVLANRGPLPCSGCHADQTTPDRWGQMSGEHRLHLEENGVNCTSCHAATTAADPAVVSDPPKHVDGQRQVVFGADAAGVTWNAGARTCTGTCHGENHQNEPW